MVYKAPGDLVPAYISILVILYHSPSSWSPNSSHSGHIFIKIIKLFFISGPLYLLYMLIIRKTKKPEKLKSRIHK